MKIYLAPMEGVTSDIYRKACHELVVPYDRYYTPFLSPTRDRFFTTRQRNEILPEHNAGVPLVPQLLCSNAEDFLWAAGEIHAMGYDEINLNLGCSSGTVVPKGKGSGALRDLQTLERFLDAIFTAAPCNISVKTRLGLQEPDEFGPILELYNRYPICELTIHPRVQKQQYRGSVYLDAFAAAASASRAPVCYSGDLFRKKDAEHLLELVPQLQAVMLGRGAIANPGLASLLRGGDGVTREQLTALHDRLYSEYRARIAGERPVIYKMREIWMYMSYLFEDTHKCLKRIRKAEHFDRYEQETQEILRNYAINPEGYWQGVK